MKRALGILVLLSVVFILAFPMGAKENSGKITIYVAKFNDASGETGRSWWYNAGIQDVGEVFRAYIKNRLLRTGQFRVLDVEKTFDETEDLNIIAAQTNPSSAYRQSKLELHAYVIEGTIANVSVVNKGSGGIGAALGLGVDYKTRITSVSVMVNMRDQESGETLFSEQVGGEKKRKAYTVVTEDGSFAIGALGERAGDVGFALKDATDKIINFVLERFPIEGTILKVIDGGKRAYVDLGSNQGIKKGDILLLIEYEEIDLGVKIVYESHEIGSCKVISIIDETTCKVEKKKGKLKKGDIVRVQSRRK